MTPIVVMDGLNKKRVASLFKASIGVFQEHPGNADNIALGPFEKQGAPLIISFFMISGTKSGGAEF